MSLKHSLAQKKRWTKVSKAERSKQMSKLALRKSSKMSLSERKRHSVKMVNARKPK